MLTTHLLQDTVEAVTKKDLRALDNCASIASKIDCANHAFAQSRFIETGIIDGKPYVKKVTEANISNAVDMSDCEDDFERSWFWLGDDGILHPVTIGKMERFANEFDDNAFYFAGSDIVANGQVVGSVTYTDH